jgi:hypothetical protein
MVDVEEVNKVVMRVIVMVLLGGVVVVKAAARVRHPSVGYCVEQGRCKRV